MWFMASKQVRNFEEAKVGLFNNAAQPLFYKKNLLSYQMRRLF